VILKSNSLKQEYANTSFLIAIDGGITEDRSESAEEDAQQALDM
jgi:hypothetical protein